MEAGGKDCEEETLQTAFKKLRVDAESLPGAASVSEALVPRVTSRACLDASGVKLKLGCPKDNWHGCMRKTSRGVSRSQRRRRSKSPILHPPKFTYCSPTTPSVLSTPSGCLKQQRLAVPEPADPCPAVEGRIAAPPQKELSSSGTTSHIAHLVFGSCAGYETHVGAVVSPASLKELPTAAAAAATPPREDGGSSGDVQSSEESDPEKSACEGAECRTGAPLMSGPADTADFRALSERHSSASAEGPHTSCSCSQKKSSASQEEGKPAAEAQCQCRSLQQGWHGVEVYSFTGLRNVISECERGLPSHDDASRTVSASSNAAAASASAALSSGSPRSCSEQARGYVDDITIEDLSGYMEYYLYIPKKMSHMAEMMYT